VIRAPTTFSRCRDIPDWWTAQPRGVAPVWIVVIRPLTAARS
jgi:hypothetical protein